MIKSTFKKVFISFLSLLLLISFNIPTFALTSDSDSVIDSEYIKSENIKALNNVLNSTPVSKIDFFPVPGSPSSGPNGSSPYLSALLSIIAIKAGIKVNNTITALKNYLVDNKFSNYINSLVSTNYNYDWTAFNNWCNDNNISLNGNLSNNQINAGLSLLDSLNVNVDSLVDLEKYYTNINYNGGNKNYYNDNSSTATYNQYNNTTNYSVTNKSYTYNDIDNNYYYDYDYITYINNNTYNKYYIDNNYTFYDYTTNQYNFTTTNNQNITYQNNYNNTTIINATTGDTAVLYYELPDGSNSRNLTEDEAKNGYKTSLNVASYSNGYDDDDLNFLFHFDNNEYDSAYPIANYSLSIVPNSIQYINNSNTAFNQALALSEDFDLTITGDKYDNYYSFRIYPQINDKWSLKINDVDIASRKSYIDTKYDYVEWVQTSDTNQTIGANTSTTTSNQSIGESTSNISNWVLNTISRQKGDYYDISDVCKEWANDNLKWLYGSYTGTSKNGGLTYYNYSCTYKRNLSNTSSQSSQSITGTQTTENSAQTVTGTTTTNQRTYNIINNKLYEDSGTNMINYNQWNYVSIDNSGNVFINGLDTGIDVSLNQFKISVTGDSLTYIDELASFKSNRSNTAPTIPFDSNITYYLPPVYYETVYTPKQSFDNGRYLLVDGVYSSVNSSFLFDIDVTDSLYFHINYDYDFSLTNVYSSFGQFYSDSTKLYIQKYLYTNGSVLDYIFYVNNEVYSRIQQSVSYARNSSSSCNFNINNTTCNVNGAIKTFDNFIPISFDFDNFRLDLRNKTPILSFAFVENSIYYSVLDTKTMKYGFYNPTTSDFVTNDYLIGGDIVYESNYVKQSDVKNNMLLIQSLIPINNYKFGGIRPSSPVKGDVYCSTNETGNITSVQQFNGVEWVSVVGSIYNDELCLWVNAVGFNIFLNNWTYQDVDYRADSSDMNVLIRFLTTMFNKITSALDSIIEKIKNINVDSTTITTTNNEFNVDINTDIHDLISNVNGYDSNIDLTDSNYQMTTNTLTDIKNLSTGFKAIFTTLDNNGFSLIYLIPIIILLVGLFL